MCQNSSKRKGWSFISIVVIFFRKFGGWFEPDTRKADDLSWKIIIKK